MVQNDCFLLFLLFLSFFFLGHYMGGRLPNPPGLLNLNEIH